MEKNDAALNYGAVILAAGASRRMGRPKLSLPFHGESLIRRIARVALDAGCRPVLVVLGAYDEEYRQCLSNLPVRFLRNDDWASGMAASIRLGVAAVAEVETCQGVFLLTGDQPFVSANLLTRMTDAIGRATALGCRYDDIIGVPALFKRARFPELLALEGDRGARHLLRPLSEQTVCIDFPEGKYDVDTPEAYATLPHLESGDDPTG
jgi:molybdenum cofactor cytidylyltransferase